MGKAANRKRDRKLAATAATTRAIQKAQSGVMDDMLIVMNLMTAIELNNLEGFHSAVKNLEASGSDLFHFEIKLIEENGQSTDMSLLHYAVYMGADDIIAWIIPLGVNAGDEESLCELQGMMHVLNSGDGTDHDIALCKRLILKMLRPHSIMQAMDMLFHAKAALKQQGTPDVCVWLMEQAATEFLKSQALQPQTFSGTSDTAATTV